MQDQQFQLNEKCIPTKQQLDRALQNWRLVVDPDGKQSEKEFLDFIDADIPCKGLIALFCINTCKKGLGHIEDSEEQIKIVQLIGEEIRLMTDEKMAKYLFALIFELLCIPLAYWKVAGFYQIWGTIMEACLDQKQARTTEKATSQQPESEPESQ